MSAVKKPAVSKKTKEGNAPMAKTDRMKTAHKTGSLAKAESKSPKIKGQK